MQLGFAPVGPSVIQSNLHATSYRFDPGRRRSCYPLGDPVKCYPRFASVATIFAGLLLNGGCSHRDEEDWIVRVSMPRQATTDSAERVCIQRLSEELDTHPEAKFFDIACGRTSGEWHALQYIRETRKIGYESDVGSGMSAWWSDVDDAAIHQVAEQGGTLKDFGERAGPRSKP